ncbi:BPTI/Kunitz domain-containing protein-like [Amblyomma americanum]
MTLSKPSHHKWYIKVVSCETPIMESVGECNVIILKYFFNKTSQMCESFLWNGCLIEGVFDTRLDCRLNCNPDERPGVCAERPPDSCDERKKKGEEVTFSDMDVYYYDINKTTCEKFKFCGPPAAVNSNIFTSLTTCIMQCRPDILFVDGDKHLLPGYYTTFVAYKDDTIGTAATLHTNNRTVP